MAAGAPHLAMLTLGGTRFPCVVGARGITAHKQEGDQATPAGLLPLRRILFRADRVSPPPRAACPREPIAPDDGWCDAPGDPAYNRRVTLPYGSRAERLWREEGLYDLVGVLGWNDQPVVSGRGSAIFLHVAPPGDAPTEGCIGLARADLLRVLEAGLSELEISPA